MANLNPMFGTDGDDFIFGSNRMGDNIKAGDGDDTVLGRRGHDRIHGADGDDTLSGGNGNDEIFADAGSDFIFAGRGNDVVWLTKNERGDRDVVDLGEGRDICYVGDKGTMVARNVNRHEDHFVFVEGETKLDWEITRLQTERVDGGWALKRAVFQGKDGDGKLVLNFEEPDGSMFSNPVYDREPSLDIPEWRQLYLQGGDEGWDTVLV